MDVPSMDYGELEKRVLELQASGAQTSTLMVQPEIDVEKFLKKIQMVARMKEELQIPDTYKRDAPKIGRNKPCPCGSGIKYKRCCGRSDA
jgi:uncharacterized protein YecA (UPF0149 family)